MGQSDTDKMQIATRYRELLAMRARFPQLPDFGQGGDLIADDDIARIEAVVSSYGQLIPVFHAPAREAQFRNAMVNLGNNTDDAELKEHTIRLIAESDIRSGVINSTYVRKYPDLWERVQDSVAQHNEAYGADIYSHSWRRLSRGGSLIYYFANHDSLLDGKKILHIAPEVETQNWFNSQKSALNIDYLTMNLAGDMDFIEDLTALNIPDESFDWIICHRVLEHIFDDLGAMREAFRILRPGGIFNLSVPESMHMPASEEWLIQDLSHHYHYRQYGANVSQMLESVGFDARPVSWLLERAPEELDEAGAYPLRMYNGIRS